MKKLMLILMGLLFYSQISGQTDILKDTLNKWHKLATKYTRIDNYNEALKYCKKLLDVEPKNCKYLGLKAAILNTTGQYFDAEQALLNLLNYGCDSIRCYIMLSNTQKYQKNYSKALDYLDSAIKLRSDSAELYIQKALIYTILRDKESDIKCLQKAKSLGSKRAAELLEILEHPR